MERKCRLQLIFKRCQRIQLRVRDQEIVWAVCLCVCGVRRGRRCAQPPKSSGVHLIIIDLASSPCLSVYCS